MHAQIREDIGLDPRLLQMSEFAAEDSENREPDHKEVKGNVRLHLLEVPMLHSLSYKGIGRPPGSPSSRTELQVTLQPAIQQASRTPAVCDAAAILNKLFAQPMHASAPLESAAEELRQMEAQPSSAEQCTATLLPVSAVAPSHNSMTVRAHIAAEVVQPCQSAPFAESSAPDLSKGLTFHDLIAPAQVLLDSFQTLPLVLFEEDLPSANACKHSSSLMPPGRIAGSLQLKQRSVASIELLLDWSLTDPAAPDPSGRIDRARKKLQAGLVPEVLRCTGQSLPDVPWRELVREAAGPLQLPSGQESAPERHPAAVVRHLRQALERSVKEPATRTGTSSAQAEAGVGNALQTVPQQASAATTFSTPAANQAVQGPTLTGKRSAGAAALDNHAVAEAAERPALERLHKAAVAKRMKKQDPKEDAAFFFGLQADGGNALEEASSGSDDSLIGG